MRSAVMHAARVGVVRCEHPPKGGEQGIVGAIVLLPHHAGHIRLGRRLCASGPRSSGELGDLKQRAPIQPDAIDQAGDFATLGRALMSAAQRTNFLPHSVRVSS